MIQLNQMLRAFAEDEQGASIVEFALIAPALLITVLGLFDIGYNMYIVSQMQGAIQKVSRDSTIVGAEANAGALDAKLQKAVHSLVPSATVQVSRKSYATFADVSRPEDWTDTNNNGTCDGNEPFEDVNGNGYWDTDRGTDGFGAARDAVVLTVDVSYPRAFPMAGLIGISENVDMQAQTVLRNQPFQDIDKVVTVGNC